MTGDLYDVRQFGMHQSATDGITYAVFVSEKDQQCFYAYISIGYTGEPCVEFDESSILDYKSEMFKGKKPVIQNLILEPQTGAVTIPYMRDNDELHLNSEQYSILSCPSSVQTLCGRYTEVSAKRPATYYKDNSLDGLCPIELDEDILYRELKKKWPALFQYPSVHYGNRPPSIPFGKYFPERNQMIIFLESKQCTVLNDKIKTGIVPFYTDPVTGQKWDISSIYALCVIDPNSDGYNLRMHHPSYLIRKS